jgi:hypothetical protein
MDKNGEGNTNQPGDDFRLLALRVERLEDEARKWGGRIWSVILVAVGAILTMVLRH